MRLEPAAASLRQKLVRLLWSVSAVALLAFAAGCAASTDGGPAAAPAANSAIAVWTLAPDQDVDADTTEFTALVSRLGCNSGVTGEVNAPDVQLADDRIVLTFTVTPGEPAGGDCQGNNEVPYDIALSEPLGNRQLVDGQCLDSEASQTSFCDPDGVRHRP